MADRLIFKVQGSAPEPYRVLAEGHGAGLRMFCTCPAGDRGGRFCKHAAGLLMGEVTRLVEGHDGVVDLARRAEGSPLLERALDFTVREPESSIVGTSGSLHDDMAAVLADLAVSGWAVVLRENAVGVGRPLKSGAAPKRARIELTYWPERTRCYRLDAPDDGGAKTFKDLNAAALAFRAAVLARANLLR